MRTWSTEKEYVSYRYHAGKGVVVSGHWGGIICWDVRDGSEVKSFEEYVCWIRDMCAHKELPLIIFAVGTTFAGEVKTLDITTGDGKTVVHEKGRFIAQFDHSDDNIICMDMNKKQSKHMTLVVSYWTLYEFMQVMSLTLHPSLSPIHLSQQQLMVVNYTSPLQYLWRRAQ